MAKTATRRLRIPVELVNGNWECQPFGGLIPLKDRSRAELIVERDLISDSTFLSLMERRDRHKVLDEGTTLLVCVTIKPNHPAPDKLKPILKSYQQLHGTIATELFEMAFDPVTQFFVEAVLAGPDDKQSRLFGTQQGGLWLLTQGRQVVGLASTTIRIPGVREEPVKSLNHALTILSETFETWRISHTGNIYRQVLYKESNGTWCPLDILRAETLASQEHEIANNLWRVFMTKMTSRTKA